MKKFLFILKRPPHTGLHVLENLDMLLTSAAFDQPVTVLVIDDGVYQLKTNQDSRKAGLKDSAAQFSALPVYDVEQIYVETESLQERGLHSADLLLPVQLLPRAEIGAWLGQFQILIGD